MQKLCADMDLLTLAWEDESPDNLYYLDTRSGVVKLVHKHLYDLRDLTDEIERDRERFLYVPKPDKGEMRKDLRSYMSKIKTQSLLPVLEMAFESPHSYMAFHKILEKEPQELKLFLSDREKLVRERIDQWLAANDYIHDSAFVNPLDELSENDADDAEDDYHLEDESDADDGDNEFSPGRD